ncbi:hypothetical protein EX30DRAFT_375099 [Ascodesmis nigricans]|uniref:Uncharacterized protein n=1 Tax=Ascodesmis nigricans TaxID=341454 RepID=A0A4S2MIZ2_9PEZI|nr:hypothetical protein EX30DRAFT_375099 [Ascodesmis nigricans]
MPRDDRYNETEKLHAHYDSYANYNDRGPDPSEWPPPHHSHAPMSSKRASYSYTPPFLPPGARRGRAAEMGNLPPHSTVRHQLDNQPVNEETVIRDPLPPETQGIRRHLSERPAPRDVTKDLAANSGASARWLKDLPSRYPAMYLS